MDYDIIDAVSSETLVTRVRKKLDEGWRTLGAPMHVGGTWCQAMTHGGTDAFHITHALQELAGTIERK